MAEEFSKERYITMQYILDKCNKYLFKLTFKEQR